MPTADWPVNTFPTDKGQRHQALQRAQLRTNQLNPVQTTLLPLDRSPFHAQSWGRLLHRLELGIWSGLSKMLLIGPCLSAKAISQSRVVCVGARDTGRHKKRDSIQRKNAASELSLRKSLPAKARKKLCERSARSASF
jgi:hypothetical protein